MPISIQCPGCGKQFNAADKYAGRRVKCPGCQEPITIPADAAAPAADVSASVTPKQSAAKEPTWQMMAEDGNEYGPITRQELESWLAQGRIDETCQLLCEGWDQWKWAAEVFPSVSAKEPVATAPAVGAQSAPMNTPTPAPMAAEVPQPRAAVPTNPTPAPAQLSPGMGGIGPGHSSGGNAFVDILLFRRGIAPIGIQILFWYATIHFLYNGIDQTISGIKYDSIRVTLNGIGLAIIGPIFARVAAEVTILFYRIFEVLVDIRKNLK